MCATMPDVADMLNVQLLPEVSHPDEAGNTRNGASPVLARDAARPTSCRRLGFEAFRLPHHQSDELVCSNVTFMLGTTIFGKLTFGAFARHATALMQEPSG